MSRVRTVGLLTSLNIGNAALGLLNTVVVAYYFGTSRGVEVYLAAVGLLASVTSLAQTGQVSEVLLPSYHALKQKHGRELAYAAFTALSNRFLALLSVMAILAWLAAAQLTRLRVPGFETADVAIATAMFRWLLPLVVLQVGAEMLRTLCNAERLFGAPEAVGCAARLLSLTALLLLAPALQVWALVVALWVAGIVEAGLLLVVLRARDYRYRLLHTLPTVDSGAGLFRKLLTTLPYVGMTQVYLFIFDAALSNLPQGAFALFRYASTLWSRTQGIFLRPVSVPFFTDFSERSAQGSGRGRELTHTALARVIAVTAVVSTAVLAGSARLLSGLWESGRFPLEHVGTLAWLLAGLYAILPLAGAATILRKVTVSLHLVRETYLALAAVQIASAALAWKIVPAFGLQGALLVAALNMLGFCVAPILVLRSAGSPIRIGLPVDRLWRWLVAVACGLLLAAVVDRLLLQLPLEMFNRRMLDVALGLLLAALGAATAFGVSAVLSVPESLQLASILKRVPQRTRA